MAEKKIGQPDIGLLVEEQDKYRPWQHKLFIEKETGHEFQCIGFAYFNYAQLGVLMSWTRLPRYKRVVGIDVFTSLFEPVVT